MTFGDPLFFARIGSFDLYDEHGVLINSSGGRGPAVDPALVQFELVPVTLFKGDRLKGKFMFRLENASDYTETLAQFSFDFDLPIYPEVRIYPKQTVTANGLEILLDSVTITPMFTQAYLCFQPPSHAPWAIGSQTVLETEDQEISLYNARELFNSATGGDRTAGSEPYWAPPVKNGSCSKIGFQSGSSNPASLTLTIPALENLMPYIYEENPLGQLSTLYPGLSEKQAFQKYLEENDYTYIGSLEIYS